MKKALKFMSAMTTIVLTMGVMLTSVCAAVQTKEYKETMEVKTTDETKTASYEITAPQFIGFFETKIPVIETYYEKDGIELKNPTYQEMNSSEMKMRVIPKDMKIMVVRKTSETLNLNYQGNPEDWKKGLAVQAKYVSDTSENVDSLFKKENHENGSVFATDRAPFLWDESNKGYFTTELGGGGLACSGKGVSAVIYDGEGSILSGGYLAVQDASKEITSFVVGYDAVLGLTEADEEYYLKNNVLPTNQVNGSWEGIDLTGLKKLLTQ